MKRAGPANPSQPPPERRVGQHAPPRVRPPVASPAHPLSPRSDLRHPHSASPSSLQDIVMFELAACHLTRYYAPCSSRPHTPPFPASLQVPLQFISTAASNEATRTNIIAKNLKGRNLCIYPAAILTINIKFSNVLAIPEWTACSNLFTR